MNNLNLKTLAVAAKLVAISAAAVLTACASNSSGSGTGSSSFADKSGYTCQKLVGQSTDGKATDVCFPDARNAWLKNGTIVNSGKTGFMRVGLNDDQVRELISYPHFNEGFFGPSVWNYTFNLATGNAAETIACQYQVQFENGLTKNMYWNSTACEKASVAAK